MKIIFLDIDGVLNSEKDFIEQEKTQSSFVNWTPRSDMFDNKIKLLKLIIENTGAKVVLSSSWRYNDKTYKLVKDTLKQFDIDVIDRTQDGVELKQQDARCHSWWRALGTSQCGWNLHRHDYTTDRGCECLTYLKKHWYRFITNYILIDDEDIDIKNWIKDKHFVHTTFRNGLTMEKVLEAIKKLNKVED